MGVCMHTSDMICPNCAPYRHPRRPPRVPFPDTDPSDPFKHLGAATAELQAENGRLKSALRKILAIVDSAPFSALAGRLRPLIKEALGED